MCDIKLLPQFSSVQFHQIHYKSKRTSGYRTSHYNIHIHTHTYTHTHTHIYIYIRTYTEAYAAPTNWTHHKDPPGKTHPPRRYPRGPDTYVLPTRKNSNTQRRHPHPLQQTHKEGADRVSLGDPILRTAATLAPPQLLSPSFFASPLWEIQNLV
jgi:hypothetical protein